MKGIHVPMQKFGSKNFILYEKIILTLLAIYSVASNVYAVNNSHIYSMVQFIATFGIMIVGLFEYSFIYIKSIYKFFFFLFLLLILVIFKFSYIAFSIFSLGIAFSNIQPSHTVYMYKYLVGIQLVISFVAANLNFLPMYNYRTGSLTFGFINENITGMLLAVFGLCIFFKCDGEFAINRLKIMLLIVILVLEKFLFKDSTALVMIISFYIFLFLFKNKFSKVKVIQLICVFMPIILATLAFYVSYNFSLLSSNWITKLNDILTERIYIWNYYVSNYPLTLFPNNWQTNNGIFNGYFDGGYIYLGIFQGKIMLTIITLGLCLANFELIVQRKFGLLAIMLAFEVAGFAENVFFNINESFALIFAILAFNPEWMNEEKSFS